MNHRRSIKTITLIVIALMLLVACSNASTTPDETAIARAVVETIAAGATETAQAVPTQAPTPKPTNTSTPKPPTATPTPYRPQFGDVAPLGCEEDEFQGITWCSIFATDDIENAIYSPNDEVEVKVYVGIKGQGESASPDVFLRWAIAYVGDDWIFIDQIVFLVDGEKHTLPVDSYEDVSSDVLSGGSVLEIYDSKVQAIPLLVDIANADEVKIRVSGDGGHHDHILTDREIEIVTRALATYEQHGGRLP